MFSSPSSSAASARQNDPMLLPTTSVWPVTLPASGTQLREFARVARKTRGGMCPHLSALAAHLDSSPSTSLAPVLPTLLTSTPTASASAATFPAGGTKTPNNATAALPATSTASLRTSVSALRTHPTSLPIMFAPHAMPLEYGILKNFSASPALQVLPMMLLNTLVFALLPGHISTVPTSASPVMLPTTGTPLLNPALPVRGSLTGTAVPTSASAALLAILSIQPS